ncbi:hypothetical protein [Streptomyces sp. NPDC002403]
MSKPNGTAGHTARTIDTDFNEALRRTATVPAPRRLIAAGVKRGNGRLVIKAVA